MSDTYRLMCSTEPMRGILSKLWKADVGDKYWDTWNNWEGVWIGVDAFSKQHTEGLDWLPREGDLMEMLKEFDYELKHRKRGNIHEYRIEDLYKDPDNDLSLTEFHAYDKQEALLLAFGHTQGLKWEYGKWERR